LNNINTHIPVLLNQVIEFLNPVPGKVFIDCTLGAGGHSEAILQLLKGQGALYGIDADPRNLEIAQKRLEQFKNVNFIHENFDNLQFIGKEILKKEKRIDGILFDLGLSSLHVDESSRGFSFLHDGPLDMRFNPHQRLTAADIVNTYPYEELLSIFKTYGEEKFSHRIATAIVEHRRHGKFETTSQLANFVTTTVAPRPDFYFKRHPATRIFQALRIATNRELEVLHSGLAAAVNIISPGGRIVAISYHSLEDRIVKHFFREKSKNEILNVLTKRPIEPDEKEYEENRRSRSAKLRAAEKI